MLFIMLNSLLLAIEHYNQPKWLKDFSDIANYVFTVIFFLEMAL